MVNKPYNGNRYAGMYDDYVNQITTGMRNRDQQTKQDQDKAQSADMWASLAEAGLPILGAVGGGIVGGLATGGAGIVPGATIGGTIGNAAGQAVGQGIHNSGQAGLDEDTKREMERQALLAALQAAPRMG